MTGTIPEQLEALSVEAWDGSSNPQNLSGKLTVGGSDRDFALSMEINGLQTAFRVHSPGAFPLATLAGEAMQIETTDIEGGSSSLFVTDASGLLYVGVFGDDPSIAAAEKRFGSGFIRLGDEVARQTDESFIWSYRKAVFDTDDGDVALDPGEVKFLHLNGVTWRAVVTASYTVTTNPEADELPGCSPEGLLGFELLRVTEATASEAPIRRSSTLGPAAAGCFASSFE
ncbi:Hypothetical protein A7982_00926 [Minicystis rosea]|nr:Hypothetical protein A7982_00926 [Minicystis rosea]